MRPAGDVRQAMWSAVREMHAGGQGATLAELAERSGVGRDAARRCVDNMRRAGALQILGERRVDYRNRPVAVYAPVDAENRQSQGWMNLGQRMAVWAR